MASATLLSFMFLAACLCGTSAGGGLRASHGLKDEKVSVEDIHTSLLAEIESSLGAKFGSWRLKEIEEQLKPIFLALPHTPANGLGHTAVRYALHRLFVSRHGWVIKGLDPADHPVNSNATTGVLKDQVPAYIQVTFEKRLGGKGLGLHDLAVLASTVEHLIHSEAVGRLGAALKVKGLLPTSAMDESTAVAVLEAYMMGFILGEDLNIMTPIEVTTIVQEMVESFTGWASTLDFVKAVLLNVSHSGVTTVVDQDTAASSSDSASTRNFVKEIIQKESREEVTFPILAKVVDTIGENYGTFQNFECMDLKADLLRYEYRSSGRIKLADFYKPSLDGTTRFAEDVDSLRKLGVLDETNPAQPMVVIANYLGSPSNCIASSGFYAVCCKNECEALFSSLEAEIAAPEASPEQISRLVEELPSPTVAAPRKLSTDLRSRLDDIAKANGGKVPLHGRLFSQWMHHAFPRECPYPTMNATSLRSAEEWMEHRAQSLEESSILEQWSDTPAVADALYGEDDLTLPWSSEERIVVQSSDKKPSPSSGEFTSTLRSLSLGAASLAAAYSIAQAMQPKKQSGILAY